MPTSKQKYLRKIPNGKKLESSNVKPIVAKPRTKTEEHFKAQFHFKVAYQNIKYQIRNYILNLTSH